MRRQTSRSIAVTLAAPWRATRSRPGRISTADARLIAIMIPDAYIRLAIVARDGYLVRANVRR